MGCLSGFMIRTEPAPKTVRGIIAGVLETRRAAQRHVIDGLIGVASRLVPGDREIDAAARIRESLSATGWFHEPYVWFGARTAPRGRRRAADFAPSDAGLAPGMPVILDAAPIIDGDVIDASYSFACGANLE